MVDGILKYFNVIATDLAVVVQNDKFGLPLVQYIEQSLKGGKYPNVKLVGSITLDRKATKLDNEAQQILSMRPRAVIGLCNPTTCAELVATLHKQTAASLERRPAIAQLSNIDMLAQFQKVGGTGMVGNPFAQVMPDPRRPVLQISRDFIAAAKEHGVEVNYRSYEGYVSAAVLVEGLRRAKSLTRQGVKDAMEGLGNTSVGGFSVEYTTAKRTGSNCVELVSLDTHGRLLR